MPGVKTETKVLLSRLAGPCLILLFGLSSISPVCIFCKRKCFSIFLYLSIPLSTPSFFTYLYFTLVFFSNIFSDINSLGRNPCQSIFTTEVPHVVYFNYLIIHWTHQTFLKEKTTQFDWKCTEKEKTIKDDMSCNSPILQIEQVEFIGQNDNVKVTSLKMPEHFPFLPVTHLEVYTCRVCSFRAYRPSLCCLLLSLSSSWQLVVVLFGMQVSQLLFRLT